MIRSLLVANRGEIARRVFRSARAMGMHCVGVYTSPDAAAPFVGEADQAVLLPGGYLDGDALIAAALATGSEAVHPGYGFLSENADFARAVIDAGLIWVGPPADVIESMGDKITAKRLATKAGLATLPSTEALDATADIGYPLLVKASAGGGGKGMRVVERPADLAEAVAAARREALSGFGDDSVFFERYLARTRHVEIQIMGDSYGNLVHFAERECSIQRRHQKIIEESPSPRVDAELRSLMGEAALALARSIGYQSAGTVEFLLDEIGGEFFFLEVNTRLQVEHPVTEAITGIDLVRDQLRVAGGDQLGYAQPDVTFAGHAIEARLYAEDPAQGFLPASGTLTAFVAAAEPAVRWDSGVEQGSVVGVEFDPMLAKVIAHAPTRHEAAGRLALALERLHVGGVTTNRDFLVATLRSDEFLAGDTTTDFVARVAGAWPDPPASTGLAAITAALWLQGRNRADDDLWGFAPSNWHNAGLPAQRVDFIDTRESTFTVAYRPRRDGSFSVDTGEQVRIHRWSPTDIDIEIDGFRRTARVSRAGSSVHVQVPGTTVSLQLVARFSAPGSEVPTGALVAPMPGVVIELRVGVGDQVEAQQVLVVLEAMKMEHHICAPGDGTVGEVSIAVGQQLVAGELLLTINPDEVGDEGSPDG